MIHITRKGAGALAIAVSGAAIAAGCGTTAVERTTAQNTTVATSSSTPTSSTTPTTPTFSTTPTTPTFATTPTTPTIDTETADVTTDVTPGGTVDIATFVSDLQEFAQVLTQFGLTLQAAAEGPAALRARSSTMRGQLDRFDEIVKRMGAYRLDMPTLEKRRAALVAASPEVSRLGRELLDAAEAGDGTRVQSVAKDFIKAIERLQKAASGA